MQHAHFGISLSRDQARLRSVSIDALRRVRDLRESNPCLPRARSSGFTARASRSPFLLLLLPFRVSFARERYIIQPRRLVSQGSDDGHALAGANSEGDLAASENSVKKSFFYYSEIIK